MKGRGLMLIKLESSTSQDPQQHKFAYATKRRSARVRSFDGRRFERPGKRSILPSTTSKRQFAAAPDAETDDGGRGALFKYLC